VQEAEAARAKVEAPETAMAMAMGTAQGVVAWAK
jgi:hypothetical protein